MKNWDVVADSEQYEAFRKRSPRNASAARGSLRGKPGGSAVFRRASSTSSSTIREPGGRARRTDRGSLN